MVFSLKTRIWLTVFSIVIMFTFFTLFYFPAQERKLLLRNYNTELQNLANTVALGVSIALIEQHFEGVETAMQFVKDDPRLQFVSIVEQDTVWSDDRQHYTLEKKVFKTFPETEHPDPDIKSGSGIVIKRGAFASPIMSGNILLAFSTKDINESEAKIRRTSLIVSSIVLIIGVLLGLVLARKVSVPVMALRDAARKISEGDLSQKVKITSSDEIGQLGKAFNEMVDDLYVARKELHKNNQELSATNGRLNNTLRELKSTQVQLIQSEKMASLGELTAGIAHEIQNPLNFVNNFSDVNTELIDEMKIEIEKGNYEEVVAIAQSIRENQDKITHHGKRADAIVKGMLHHSRTSSGQKEMTDINALADEYLRLSYHGLRAKDKSFNVTLKTDFDETSGQIKIISQDIGRVFLNLYNNAFYAVMEKKREYENSGQGNYEPKIFVSTRRMKDQVEIRIKDNGPGISEKVLDKMYQPFFTTKPTGQGTGLGLSLSYDIVKAHGGEIKVQTKEGEYAEFIIDLPA